MSKPLPQNRLATISLNLLPKDQFLESIFGKFLVWSLSIGRYLVILTELVVILTFISRFKLDRDLTDLNEQIEIQKQVILSYADTEARFLAIQTKAEFIKEQQETDTKITSLDFLEKNLPVDVKLTSINLQPNRMTLVASALSAQSVKRTATQIASHYPQAEIALSEVKLNSQAGTIDFSMSVSQDIKAKKMTTRSTNKPTQDSDL